MKQLTKSKVLLVLCFVLLTSFLSLAFYNSATYVASVEIQKMNILYIGVDNPVTVAVAGVSTGKVRLESDALKIEEVNVGQYILKATKPGKATLNIFANNELVSEKIYRVKRIPDPVARLGNSSGGRMSAGFVHKSEGLMAYLHCFDFDARCAIRSFHVTLVREGADPIEMINTAAKFNSNTKKLMESVQAGDVIYFDNVKCQCPGDKASRAINSLVFKII